MARIKQVLAERRLAAIEAAHILRQKGDDAGAERLEHSEEFRGLHDADISTEGEARSQQSVNRARAS